jgi:hypothetical protein
MEHMLVPQAFTYFVLLMCILLVLFCHFFWLKLETIRLKFRRQGIRGPLPSFVLGNIPEMLRITSMVPSSETKNKDMMNKMSSFYSSVSLFQFFKQWTAQYGKHKVYLLEHMQVLVVFFKFYYLIHITKVSELLSMGT